MTDGSFEATILGIDMLDEAVNSRDMVKVPLSLATYSRTGIYFEVYIC